MFVIFLPRNQVTKPLNVTLMSGVCVCVFTLLRNEYNEVTLK